MLSRCAAVGVLLAGSLAVLGSPVAAGGPCAAPTVLGTDGPDRIRGGSLDQPARIYARGGNDRIFGSEQDDVLNGGPGWDRGTGWGGHDRYVSVERIRHR